MSQTDNGVSPSSHISPIIERLADKTSTHLAQEGGVTQFPKVLVQLFRQVVLQ